MCTVVYSLGLVITEYADGKVDVRKQTVLERGLTHHLGVDIRLPSLNVKAALTPSVRTLFDLETSIKRGAASSIIDHMFTINRNKVVLRGRT